MPTVPELMISLITDQPLSAEEKREFALHVLRLARRVLEAQGLSEGRRRRLRGQPTQGNPDHGTRGT